MTAHVYHEIWCDSPGDGVEGCANAYPDAGTATQVRKRAQQAGWSVNRPGGKDFCPTHRLLPQRAPGGLTP